MSKSLIWEFANFRAISPGKTAHYLLKKRNYWWKRGPQRRKNVVTCNRLRQVKEKKQRKNLDVTHILRSPFVVQKLSLYTTRRTSTEFWWVNGWMDGWMDRWVVIFYPLGFSLFSTIITSKMSWFQKYA